MLSHSTSMFCYLNLHILGRTWHLLIVVFHTRVARSNIQVLDFCI